MSRPRLWLVALVALAQVALVLGLAAREEVRLAEGREVLLAVRPVDPRDILRGDYVILTYDIERLSSAIAADPALDPGGPAWLVVTAPPGAVAAAERVLAAPPPADTLSPDQVALRVRWESRADGSGWHHLTLPEVGRFYVPEGTGMALEEAIRAGAVTARLRVGDDGGTRLETLLVDGEPWSPGG